MARTRTDWTVCRLAPDVAGSVEYLVDIRLSDARWLSSPLVSVDRAEAWTGHRQAADSVADILNLHGGGHEDRGAWTALPAVIHAPSPYQPQEKGAEERRRGANSEDVSALRVAISGHVAPAPARGPEGDVTASIIRYCGLRDLPRSKLVDALEVLGATSPATAALVQNSLLRD